MEIAYVGLGSNLGDRWEHLTVGARRLVEAPATGSATVSPVYETEAHTRTEDRAAPDFLNAVLRLETDWTPLQLLEYVQTVEAERGRDPAEEEWAPRPLDLDILVFGELSCRTPRLTIPHARLAERRFVLRPLVDLDPDLWIPDPHEATARSLLARCADAHRLRRCDRQITLGGSA